MGINERKIKAESKRGHAEHKCVYIYIYRSSFILIFKPTKSCKYNFWMKGTGKIRQCWYNTQKKKYITVQKEDS